MLRTSVWLPLSICLLFSAFSLSAQCGCTDCRCSDSLELVKLYQATDSTWTNKTGWKWPDRATMPLSSWYGVTLDLNGRVLELRLQRNSLQGTIPALSLSKLEYLVLSFNQLRGNLPSLNLPRLKWLVLGANYSLTGQMPNLNAFPILEWIELSGNQFEGEIPVLQHSEMALLNLAGNKFKGTFSISNMPKLRSLFLQINKFDSCKVPNIDALEYLGLQTNNLTFKDVIRVNMTPYSVSSGLTGYNPQDSIFKDTTYNVRVSDPLSINLNIDGALTSNRYVLWKDGARFTELGDTLFVNNFTIPSVQPRHAGVYEVRVTNPNAPLLTLISRKITVIANASAASCLVTNTNDSGAGSLREAINCANSSVGIDTIKFAINSAAPWIFSPTTIYPTITSDSVIIDATSQSGWGLGKMVINGNNIFYAQGTGEYVINVNGVKGFEMYGLAFTKTPIGAIQIANSTNFKIGASGKGNVFYGNGRTALNAGDIYITNTQNGKLQGNIIGLDENLVFSSNPYNGIHMRNNVANIQIGGSRSLNEGNIIAKYQQYGIRFGETINSEIYGNNIGTARNGTENMGNTLNGIYIFANANNNIKIGSATNSDFENWIAYNGFGITREAGNSNVTISRNKMYCNSIGIKDYNTPLPISPPIIQSAKTNVIVGTTGANNSVEIFADASCNNCQGKTYLGTVTANSSGDWLLNGTFSNGSKITATATDASNNTSQFSACVTVCLTPSVSVATSTTNLCGTKPIMITVTTAQPNLQYKWAKDGQALSQTSANLQVTQVGNYTVTVSNSNGCDTVITKTIGLDNSCRCSDSLSLVALYAATDSANWWKKWNLNQPIDTWYGIKLNSSGCVSEIRLRDTISGNNTNFSWGSGTGNNLRGQMIDLDLPSLRYATFYGNKLTGNIPNFSKIINCWTLDLGGNQFTSVPNFTTLPNLTALCLHNNRLTDTLPLFSGVPQLFNLWAYGNKLTSTKNLKTVRRLGVLRIFNNKLTFESILRNWGTTTFEYAAQDSVFKDTTIASRLGDPLSIKLNFDDTVRSNTYQWRKIRAVGDTLILASTTTNSLLINRLQASDAGVYEVQVTNSIATQLTLYSRKITIVVNPNTTCRYNDSLALVTLYDSTQGDRWLNTINNDRKWKMPNVPITNWYGVYTNAAGCVVGLDFDGVDDGSGNHNSGNLLRGMLPDAVFNMSALKTLFLSGNPINVLPNAIGRLNNLTNLHVERCGLTALPDSLWTLRQLEGLNISQNTFNAPFPTRIGQLTNLYYLLIHNSGWTNETAGADALVSLQMLKKLGYLDASANNFSGTLSPTIWTIDSIGVVILRNNRLTSLGTATPRRAVLFDVQDNRLTSALNFTPLPIQTGDANWGGLRLKGNQLTFTHILPSMGIASRANRFFYSPQDSVFTTTTLTGRAGDPLSIKLNFDDTVRSNSYQWRKIRGVSDTIIVGTTTANSLFFRRLQASDAGVYEVRVTNSIATQLTLYSRKITVVVTPNTTCRYLDSFALVDFYRATNMQNATAQYRWNLDTLMTTWKGVGLNANGCVECLDLDGDASVCNGYSDNPPGVGLSGVFPSAIGRLTRLYRLHLRGNRNLTGQIPDSIRYLTNLAALYIDSTGLTGALSDGFQYLTSLEDYGGYNTRFNAPIPNFFRLIKKMDTFDMTNTGTSGKFPVSLANVDSLRRLYLGNNNMTDTIPIELSRRLLHRFDISNNRFDSLPKLNLVEWQLSFVGTPYFYVQGNKLTFDDILPNLQGLPASFLKNYAPQDPIFQTITYTKSIGDTLTIDLGIDKGLNDNKYVWIKNGVRVDSSNKNTLILRGVVPCDAGTYTVEVTNSAAPLLTLKSRIITIVVSPIAPQTRNKTLCYGQKDTLPSGQIVAPTASATYPETLRNRANTCDSAMITTNLTVLPLPVVSKTDSFCFGKNYPLPQTNRLVTTAGVFSDTIAAADGCKTRYATTLTYKTDLTRTENITICTGQSYNLIDSTVNTEGSFTRRKSGLVTCDSVITTNLTVLPIPTISKIDSFCEGKSYNLPQTSRIVRATGVFRDTVRNANNCIVHYATTLTYRQNLTRAERITICSGQFYKLPNDSIVTTAGVYTSRKTTTGCDSVITTTLIVNPKPTAQIVGLNTLYCWDNTPVVLQGQPTGGTFKIDGATASNFTPSVLLVGNHTVSYIYRAANGCFDTTIQTMRLGDFGRNTINRTICPGDSVTILGKVYHQRKLSSVDTLKMAAASGCDSIITVQVTVHQRVNALDDDYEMLRNTSNILLDVLKNDIYPSNLYELTVKKQPNIGTIELLNSDKFKLTFAGKASQDIVFTYLLCHLNCANECDTALVRIKIKDKSNEFDPISGGVSPNGDGKNDKLDLPDINWGLYPDNTIEIFNRFGQKVYVAAPYKRDWEGQNTEGSPLPSGDYFIILRLDGGGKIVLGNVYLAR